MVPDANICLLRNTVQALAVHTTSRRMVGITYYTDCLFGARIDCQTNVRANRSVLECVADTASAISLESDHLPTCEAAEEIVRQLAPHVLDLWEVPR
jgi:hypothetical protein